MIDTILYAVIIIVIIQIFLELSAPYNKPSLNKQIQNIAPAVDNKIVVYWFFRHGCPHCDNMVGSWNELKKSNLPSNYTLIEVDTALDKNNKLCEQYGVSGVPHIVKSMSNGYYKVYSGNRSLDHMKNWILNN
jgi:protein-disulfide isomerase